MFEIGRVCVKIAGRDAGKTCIVIDELDERTVLIDGQTRRRKCNILHLEPTKKTADIKKNAAHDAVIKALSSLDIPVEEKKKAEKKAKGEKGVKKRVLSLKSKKEQAPAETEEKKKKKDKKQEKKAKKETKKAAAKPKKEEKKEKKPKKKDADNT